jgi:hypothetical protein
MAKIDVSKTSNELLYALLSESAGKAITAADVSAANIAAIANPEAGDPNTTVELSSVAGSTVVKPGGTEPLTRKLTRHTLADVATALGKSLAVSDDITKYDTKSYVLGKVNEILGSVLVDAEITVNAAAAVDGVREVTVAMVETAHIALNGSLVLTVTDNTDTRGTTEETFPNESLSGFEEPDAGA